MRSAAKLRLLLFGVLVALMMGVPSAIASTIDIFSGTSGTNNQTGTDIAIPVTPAWAPAGPGYEWISYGNTGCNSFNPLTGRCMSGPQNPAGVTGIITGPNPVAPTAVFYQTFTVTDSFDSGNLYVWADDTARVWIDPGTITGGDGSVGGTMLIEANPVLGNNCAAGPVGCAPNMDAVLPLNLSSGTYTLVFDAYQLIGGTPFGVMYKGVLTNGSTAPEPASYMLIGLGLAGLGALIRRRKRA